MWPQYQLASVSHHEEKKKMYIKIDHLYQLNMDTYTSILNYGGDTHEEPIGTTSSVELQPLWALDAFLVP
jgi:hypothetical protein